MSNLLVCGTITKEPNNSQQNNSLNQLTWEIRDFKKCADNAKLQQKLEKYCFISKTFKLKRDYEHDFNFFCFPNGRGDSKNIIIGLVLNNKINEDNFETVHLNWRISANSDFFSTTGKNKDSKWSGEILIHKRQRQTVYKTTKKTLRHITNCLQIFIEIDLLKDSKSEFPYGKHEIMVINYFDNLFRTGNSSDAILVAHLDDTEFKVNKEVLSSHSSVFETMFKQAPINGKYLINDIDGPILNALLQYIYTGRTKFVNLQTLGNKAELFNMYQLKISCQRWNNSQNVLNGNSANWDIYDKSKDADNKFNPKVVEQRKAHLGKMVKLYEKYANNDGENSENSSNNDNNEIEKIETSNYIYVVQNYQPEFRWLIDKEFPFNESSKYEKILHNFFVNQNKSKFCNNVVYFLLNPLTLNSIPDNANESLDEIRYGLKDGNFVKSLDQEWLPSFIRSIFYVGIGQPERPLVHFKDAYKVHSFKESSNAQRESDQIEAERDLNILNETAKLKLINEILDNGESDNGEVIVLTAFNALCENESKAIEAILIDALKPNITNIYSGTYTMNLDDHQRTLLAPHFIYNAFLTFLETRRQKVNRDSNKVVPRSPRPSNIGPGESGSQPGPSQQYSETNEVRSDSALTELINQIDNIEIN